MSDLLTDKTWNKEIMKLDFSPAKWTCEKPKYYDLTEISMTDGGGMGGCNKIIYVLEPRTVLKPNTLIEVTDFFSKKVETINTSFVVYAKDIVMLEATYNTINTVIIGNYNCDKSGNGTIYKVIPQSLKDKIKLY